MAERLRFTARELAMAATLWFGAWAALILGALTSTAARPQTAGRPTWAQMAGQAWIEAALLALVLGAGWSGVVWLAGWRWRGLRGGWAVACGVALTVVLVCGATLGAYSLYVEHPIPIDGQD
jgi:hypothetical protein